MTEGFLTSLRVVLLLHVEPQACMHNWRIINKWLAGSSSGGAPGRGAADVIAAAQHVHGFGQQMQLLLTLGTHLQLARRPVRT